MGLIWLFISALKDTFKQVQIELIKLKNHNYRRASVFTGVKLSTVIFEKPSFAPAVKAPWRRHRSASVVI